MFSDDIQFPDDKLLTLGHPAILSERMTCGACPEQWEGVLVNGVHFYFRYRFGRAQLGVGTTPDNAAEYAMMHQGVVVSDSLSGMFTDQAVRVRVFAELFGRIYPDHLADDVHFAREFGELVAQIEGDAHE